VPTLKFPGYHAVEVHDPEGAGGRQYDACQDEHQAPAKQLGTCHVDSAKVADQRQEFEFDLMR
jgi:hypothetical protein